MLHESTDNNNNMTDKELDEAVASHLKKLEALEIMGQLLEKTKLNTDSPPNESFCNDCIASDKQSEEIDKEEASNYLVRVREYLVDYQESNGVSRDEYSYGSLLKVMGQATGKSFLALFYILVNIAPMVQILLFTSRFILDKIVSIFFADDNQQKAIKSAILGLQMISIYICLFFLFGSIWIPVLQMVFGIISQIFFYN